MKTLSVTMDEVLLGEMDQGIREAGLKGRSEAIRQAVGDWLGKQALRKKVRKEIEGYRRRPVTPAEFTPLLSSQEWPS